MTVLHLVLIIVALVKVVKSQEFLMHMCSTDDTYKSNSTYQSNLNQLLSSLLSSVNSSGFSNITVGQDPNRVFGLASCRGDLSAESCQSCIQTAINNASTLCPYGKGEAIWLEECFLRYNNTNFFSQLDFRGRNWCNDVKDNEEQFNIIVGDMLNNLAYKAAKVSNQLFAAGFVNYTSSRQVYGITQCTQDLSKDDCYSCLQKYTPLLLYYCTKKLGGRLHGVSCMAHFEFFMFYNGSVIPNDAAPPPSAVPTAAPPSAEATNKAKKGGGINIAWIVGPVVAALVIFFFIFACVRWARRSRKQFENFRYSKDDEIMGRSDRSLLFDLSTIRSATNNFSSDNKLGEGGFGPVYRAKLINGQEIAVKRLSGNSHQGLEELKNEVRLLANLQHKNLVKLFGCCLDGSEKLLIYEYLSNTSLDKFLFDSVKRLELDWQMRLKLIEGIARGLVYLHEDSRLKIVHRDLKVSNILLDAHMNPKIADFGLAKLYNADVTHANTSRIAGTYGYMAPEYAMRGQFSTKSDVFSYGIIVLEILTGRSVFCTPAQMNEDLLSYVWSHWRQVKPLEAIDKSVTGHCPSQELIRCMHVALLCVQEDPSERPDMATVILMLRSQSMTLPAPTAPMVFLRSVISTNGSQAPLTEENNGTSVSGISKA